MNLSTLLADARKGLTAFVGAAGEVLALGLLHGTAERWTTAAVGIATAVLVYVVPNGKKLTHSVALAKLREAGTSAHAASVHLAATVAQLSDSAAALNQTENPVTPPALDRVAKAAEQAATATERAEKP